MKWHADMSMITWWEIFQYIMEKYEISRLTSTKGKVSLLTNSQEYELDLTEKAMGVDPAKSWIKW